MSPRKNAREKILDAAEQVIIEKGAAHMTLDSVSAKAGVSKGGLLYHFRSKNDLLLGMLQRLHDSIQNARKEASKKLPESPAKEAKAYIHSVDFPKPKDSRIAVALLAASAHNPDFIEPFRRAVKGMIDEISSAGLRPSFVMAMILAVDGLRVMELLGIADFTKEERQGVILELLRLVELEESKIKTK